MTYAVETEDHVAAAAIPGAGPFIAAGALASALGATVGAGASGAIVGGVSGGVAGALTHHGLNEAESKYYANEIEQGGTFVGVDLSSARVSRDRVYEAFRRSNGRLPTPTCGSSGTRRSTSARMGR